jgi:hypothetical protein
LALRRRLPYEPWEAPTPPYALRPRRESARRSQGGTAIRATRANRSFAEGRIENDRRTQDHEARMTDEKPTIDAKASRVAMTAIIACLVLTAAGMITREPIFGALALIVIVVGVICRRPIARMLSSR